MAQDRVDLSIVRETLRSVLSRQELQSVMDFLESRVPSVQRDREMVRLYVEEGLTQQAIGDAFGLTRARVQQIINEHMPNAVGAKCAELERRAEEAVVAERVRREAEARDAGVVCKTCGRPHARRWGGEWSATCSPACAEIRSSTSWRYAIDQDEHARHRLRTSRWTVENSDHDTVDEHRLSSAQRVLEGTHDQHGRWLIEGSKAWDVACQAYEEGWPSFKWLPESIQKQVRYSFEEAETV